MRHPHVLQLIMDSLRYWVTEMHVDGFRFDLAATLARQFHEVDRLSAFFDLVQQDPVVSQVKLIAEPWDVGEGGYQVGNFPPLWTEWNGKYRDTVRDFWRGEPRDAGRVRLPAHRLLRPLRARRPQADRLDQLRHRPRRLHPARPGLLQREAQRGQRRGQPRRREPQPLVELRRRGPDRRPGGHRAARAPAAQLPRHAAALAGRADARRTATSSAAPSSGNNNAYCQDNELSWIDWELDEEQERPARVHRRAGRAAPRPPGASAAAGSSPAAPTTAAEPTSVTSRGSRPAAEQMDDDDWANGYARSLTVFLNGEAIPEPDTRGERDRRRLLPGAVQRAPRVAARSPSRTRTTARAGWSTSTPARRTSTPSSSSRPGVGGDGTGAQRGGAALPVASRQALSPAGAAATAAGERYAAAAASRTGRHRAAGPDRDVPAAAPARLRLRRRGRAGGLPRRARRLAPLPLAGPAGGARVDARLRRRRPQPAQRGGRRARQASTGSSPAATRHGLRRRRRRRAQPHGGAHAGLPQPRRSGRSCATARSRRTRTGSTSTGSAGERQGPDAGARRARSSRCSAAGELAVDDAGGEGGDESVLRYYDHEFPVRARHRDAAAGRARRRQCYRLAYWREAGDELNYRRFFDVDHPGRGAGRGPRGLRRHPRPAARAACATARSTGCGSTTPTAWPTPRGYLDRLADATGGAWVVVEKILEGDEELPDDWRCAGTTGYDALLRVGGLFVDPRRAPARSTALCTGAAPATGRDLAERGRRGQAPGRRRRRRPPRSTGCCGWPRRVCRDDDLRDHARRRALLEALLVAIDRYRAYVVPGRARRPRAGGASSTRPPSAPGRRSRRADHDTLDVVATLVARPRGPRPPVDTGGRRRRVRRPVPADLRAGHGQGRRGHRLLPLRAASPALNEVGGDPDRFGDQPPTSCTTSRERQLATWPTAMTTLSTHDTKRSEDVRARLGVLSEAADEWAAWLDDGARAAPRPTAPSGSTRRTEYLVWQTAGRRLADRPATGSQAYLLKAVREAKVHTTWTDAGRGLRGRGAAFVDALLGDPAVARHLDEPGTRRPPSRPCARPSSARSCVQLTMPGRARRLPGHRDRRPVAGRPRQPPARSTTTDRGAAGSPALDAAQPAADLADEKLLVTVAGAAAAPRPPRGVRGGGRGYQPVACHERARARVRPRRRHGVQVVAVATRLAAGLRADGGWGAHRRAAGRDAGTTCSPRQAVSTRGTRGPCRRSARPPAGRTARRAMST